MRKIIFFCGLFLFGPGLLLFGQQKVIFKTGKIPSSKTPYVDLYLAGDFNKWNPADTAWKFKQVAPGNYGLIKYLPKGICNFKITRGSWQTVESTAYGKSIDNRRADIVNDTTITMDIENWQDNFNTEKPHTASAQVHIISEKFEIPQLDRQRRIWIYLPADYAASKTNYPVIYMHDGQNLFDEYTAGFGEWGVDEILDKLAGKQECIVVGVDHGGGYRITEYDPYDSKYGKGRGKDYVDFLAKTLKPYIDKNYRTKIDAGNTTIAGSSLGGLISMYAALKYPDVFGNAGIFSPAFWIAPEIYDFALKQPLPANSRFYFVCGDTESDNMVADMKKMADILRSKGKTTIQTPVTIIPGAGHNEKQWKGDFPGFYNWLINNK